MLGNLEALGSEVLVPLADLKEITSRRAFFQTDFGSLAVLPSASSKDTAKQAGDFLLIKPNSVNVLKRHQEVWFQFNHHRGGAAPVATHVGILIIKIVRSERALPITVHRNANWVRPGENQTLDSLDKQLGLPWNEFAVDLQNWGANANNLSMSDAVIGGQWHATPLGGKFYSWEYRQFWPLAAANFQATVANITHRSFAPEKVCVNAQLLRFTPTPVPSSAGPIVFYTNVSECDCVFVATYSPPVEDGGEDIQNWYWIRFRQ